MNILKELYSFYRYFFRTEKKFKEILFYAEHEGYYSYFEGILEELVNRKEFVSYITSDPKDPMLNKNNTYLKVFYFDKLFPFYMAFLNCKVFVMTLTDLNNFHIKRSINKVHYVYAFHSLVSTHMMYSEYAFDHYDSILCTSLYQIEEIRKREKLRNYPEKQLIEAGYYRLERIYNEFKEHNNTDNTSKKTILIAPSWGEKNIIESFGKELISLLLNNNYKVILRPHPETVRRSKTLLSKINSKFKDNKDFIMELSVSTDVSLLRADVLICDLSGVALEYAFGTLRPVLFIDVPYKIKNENYKNLEITPFELKIREQIGKLISFEKDSDIIETIEHLINNKEKYKDVITKLRNESIFNFGNSNKISANHMINVKGNK